MNAPFDFRLDKTAFNRWLATQAGTYEWPDGRVVQMTNVTRGHSRIVRNIARALEFRLDIERWSVVTSDFGVARASFVRFPDVVVEPEAVDNMSARRADRVALLFEVLSPSSVDTDLIDKPAEYAMIPTLQANVAVSQDEPICWLWALASFDVAVPHAEIYRGVRTCDQN